MPEQANDQTYTFIPVRYCCDYYDAWDAQFIPSTDTSYVVSVSDYLGKGSYAKVYKVEGWLKEGATSFASRRAVVKSRPLIVEDFQNVTYAAIKIFDNCVMDYAVLEGITSSGKSFSASITRYLNDINTEYRRMVIANGANGHIPKPYALGWAVQNGKCYPAILMEYLHKGKDTSAEGRKDVLKSPSELFEKSLGQPSPALATDEIVLVGLEIAKAVRCLHDTGMTHRDLSTGNVLIRFEDNAIEKIAKKAYLFDLGNSIARNDELSMNMDSDPDDIQNHRSQHMATPGFGAPEVFVFPTNETWGLFSQRNGFKNDVYEIAALLYYLRTAQCFRDSAPDHEGKTIDDEFIKNWNRWVIESSPLDGFKLPSYCNSPEDKKLSDIIQSCSKRYPEDRRDLDWMLAQLWSMAYPNQPTTHEEHYSWFIDSMPAPGFDIVLRSRLNDPLAQYPGLMQEQTSLDEDSSNDSPSQRGEALTGNTVPLDQPSPSVVPRVIQQNSNAVPIIYEKPQCNDPQPPHTPLKRINVARVINSFESAQKNGPHLLDGADAALGRSQYSSALDCLEKGQIYKALQMLLDSEKYGHVPASIYLARIFEEGELTQGTDYDTAIKKLMTAVERGSTQALACLGIFLAEGKGIVKDIKGACTLLQAGFNRKDEFCANNLGVIFHNNPNDFENSQKDAVQFFLSSAAWGSKVGAQNLAIACNELGWPGWIQQNDVLELLNGYGIAKESVDSEVQYVWPS